MTHPIITWQDTYDLSIDIIDEQHKKLLEIINSINHDEKIYENEEKVIELISSLRSYTHYHFDTEENLMLEYDYANFDEHKKLHQLIIHKLDTIISSYEHQPAELLSNMISLLSDWFVDHILYEDKLIGKIIAPLYNNKKINV